MIIHTADSSLSLKVAGEMNQSTYVYDMYTFNILVLYSVTDSMRHIGVYQNVHEYQEQT